MNNFAVSGQTISRGGGPPLVPAGAGEKRSARSNKERFVVWSMLDFVRRTAAK
jgi:hypothetical protein